MSDPLDARATKSQEPVDSPQSLPQASTMPASNPQESLTGLGHATLSMPSHPFAGERPSDSQASPAADVDLTQINEGQASSRQLPPYIGRFRVEHEIGSGGMGAVFRVCDPVLNRPLAVKVLLEKHKHNAHLQSRFQEEAQILGQLQHPGVPPLYDVGQLENGLPFLAMKLVKGRTLAALLADRISPAEDLPRFLAIFETVCQTIAFVHARNVIHRDLKPSNIMVGEFGEVQVMDWGLAKVLRRLEDESAERPASGDLFEQFGAIATIRTEEHGQSTQVGSVVGTFAYMAPEQARGEIDRLDERCDVFSLGALLSLILTAKPPYTAKNQEELARQSFEGDLTEALLRLEKCGADAELVTLAKACLAVRLEERPSNAAAVSERVAAYRRAVEARLRQAEVERAAAFAKRIEARKRRRLIVALAFIVGLFLLVAGAVAWRQRQVENDRTQAVESDLEETGRHRDAGRWPAAR
ncbi:MAG TPA: serine/threonine-protein kinase, partial [Gemmataceae bacterium]|nr:serine/threonine-protein kinase [Gemmataceae bacterium]